MYFRIDADRETYAELLEEYGELMKNTYEIVKDGKAPKRGMDGRLKQVFASSQTVVIPQRVSEKVEEVPQRAAQVQIALLDDLICWQAILINT